MNLLLLLVLAFLVTMVAMIACAFYFMPNLTTQDVESDEHYPFHTDIEFSETQEDFVLDNLKMCDVHNLVPCKMGEPIFGCKQLNVRCQHFAEDTKYLEYGEEIVIPQNASPNEGYALAVPIYNTSCNLYHGDLVLLSLAADIDEYMLLCECKHPGFVGKESILGNCTSVYVCQGKVEDLDRELKDLECVCEKSYEEPGHLVIGQDITVPVCRVPLVKEANDKYSDWTEMVQFRNNYLIYKEAFAPTIRNNINVRFMLDPCKNAMFYGEAIPNATYDIALRTCQSYDFGIPVRTGIIETDPQNRAFEPIDGFVSSERYEFIRYTDNIAGKRRLATVAVAPKMKIHTDQDPARSDLLYVRLPEPISLATQVKQRLKKELYVIKCGRAPGWYECRHVDGFRYLMFDLPKTTYVPHLPIYSFNYEKWDNSEAIESKGVVVVAEGIDIGHKYFGARTDLNSYGMVYVNALSETYPGNGIVWFHNTSTDSRIHKINVTS